MMNRIFEIRGECFEVSPYSNGSLAQEDDGSYQLSVNGKTHHLWMEREGDRVFVRLNGRTFEIDEIDPRGGAAEGPTAGDTAKAPMPGTVISIEVEPGQSVRNGETLMTIESMKLQTQIVAWREGEVGEIHLSAGEEFDRDAPLVSLKPLKEGEG